MRWRGANFAPAYRRRTRSTRMIFAALFAAQRLGKRGVELDRPWQAAWLPDHLKGYTAFSAIIGAPGSNRSVVLQLLGQDREPAVSLKVAASPCADAAVLHEAHALNDPTLTAIAPRRLWAGGIMGRQALATEHVSGRAGSVGHRGREEALSVLPTPAQHTPRLTFANHPWVQGVLSRTSLDLPSVTDVRGEWPLVRVHGDLAPWNLIRRPSGSVVAIDWESSDASGIPGVDFAHYVMATELLILKRRPSVARGAALAQVRRHLHIETDAARAVVRLTAATVAGQREQEGGAPNQVRAWEAIALTT